MTTASQTAPAAAAEHFPVAIVPRISIGIGVNWISPFGPLRLDLAKAIVFQKGDDPKLFTFNVGTQF